MIKVNEEYKPEYYSKTKRIKYLYHTVFNKNTYDFVKKNGIKVDNDHWIYLAEKPIINSNTYAVFKVRIPNNELLYDWREIWTDDNGKEYDMDHQYDKSNPFYMYNANIPKQYIEEVKV